MIGNWLSVTGDWLSSGPLSINPKQLIIDMKIEKKIGLILILLSALFQGIGFCGEETAFILRPFLQFNEVQNSKIEEIKKIRVESEMLIWDRVLSKLMPVEGCISLLKSNSLLKDNNELWKDCYEIEEQVASIGKKETNKNINEFFDEIETRILEKAEIFIEKTRGLLDNKTGNNAENAKENIRLLETHIAGIRSDIKEWSLEYANINNVIALYIDTLATLGCREIVSLSMQGDKDRLVFREDIQGEYFILMAIIDNILMQGTTAMEDATERITKEIKTSLYYNKWIRIEIRDNNVIPPKILDFLRKEKWLSITPDDKEVRNLWTMLRYIRLKGGWVRIKTSIIGDKDSCFLFEAKFDKDIEKRYFLKPEGFLGTHFILYLPVASDIMDSPVISRGDRTNL